MSQGRPALRAGAGLVLLALVLAVYVQVLGHGFTNFDDPVHVTGNPWVRGGLTWGAVMWALTAFYESNWHPLTWISFMVDVSIGGLDPRVFHASNLLLHALASILLFLALDRMTGRPGPSLFVAALFAVHPLHVESVAWVSERKDVLSAVFWFLALLAYARYSERPGPARYLQVAGAFALGLMAKPMVVTLPAVLLLLDIWPLGRTSLWSIHGAASGSASNSRSRGTHAPRNGISRPGADVRPGATLSTGEITAKESGSAPDPGVVERRTGLSPTHPAVPTAWTRLFLEKVPLFALSAVCSAATILAQRQGRSLGTRDLYPLPVRLANADVSCAGYLRRMFWPSDLAVFYPHPGTTVSAWKVAAAGVLLAALTVLAVAWLRRTPWFAVGWGWYLVTLLPVIGLVQVGMQGSADRYMYIPMVGPCLILAWGGAALARRGLVTWGPAFKPHLVGAVLGSAIVLALVPLARAQAATWRDDVTLFSHAIEVTPPNAVAHKALASALRSRRRHDEALAHLEEAVRIMPTFATAHSELAGLLIARGELERAAEHCLKALSLWPEHPGALNNLGLIRLRQGRTDEGLGFVTRSLAANPNQGPAHVNLALALMQQGRLEEAVAHLQAAIRLDPDNVHAYNNLGVALARLGKLEEATAALTEAARIDPEDAGARRNLEALRSRREQRPP